jgi:apolipoprotein N-acyltransferase
MWLALGGIAAVFGFAPFFIAPFYGIGIVFLFLALENAPSLKGAFWRAWFFAFVMFAASMFWLGAAFLVDAQKFFWLMPFAITLLPAALGIFWGIGGIAYFKFRPSSATKALFFAACFALIEYMRGTIFTGLPWNLPAYIFNAGGLISQNGAWLGPFGVSLFALFVFVSLLVIDQKGGKQIFALAVAICGIGFGYGFYHKNFAQLMPSKNPPIIATGQGGYSQKELYQSGNEIKVVETYIRLLESDVAKQAKVIVLPEGTFPFLLLEEPYVLFEINKHIQNKLLIVGAPRRDFSNQEQYYNSIAFISGNPNAPELLKLYDKGHLVPFGEYLPFKAVFNALGITSLVSYGTDFNSGKGPQLIKIADIPLIEPRICYEIIFPNYTNKESIKADWIVNVSVDAWYGDLLGPDQHYNQARWRAIEQGKPLVRAASGGWSSITDSFGESVVQFRSGNRLISASLPPKIVSTLYSRLSDGFFAVFLLSFFVSAILFDKKAVM